MKIVFTCGGTAGHINPAVALARMFQERVPGVELLFVGADGGMETRLVPREGYNIRTVTITNFQRSLSPASLRHNLGTLRNLSRSRRQAAAILDDFQPDLVVGTGGYASFPVVREAARRGIPTAVHESNACPGLTTKMLSKHVSRVMVGFEESRQHYPRPDRVVVTGTPVRGDFFALTRAEARAKLGLTGEKPVVLSYWGSLGAQEMNRQMVDFIRLECGAGCPFHHIHGAGKRYYPGVLEGLKRAGVRLENHPSVDVREYIYDMAVDMAAADLVICRAGASTISELEAISKPSILVPSPNVTANHQEKNARVLAERGAAVLMLEQESSGQKLYDRVKGLLDRPGELESMRRKLGEMAVQNANEQIYQVLSGLLKGVG
ncbi:MAG: UDP-N-acetylglucosamine--N-acetylmuramyl-(pentapeptide) pyrophosphoryl-undecaprenol N-acetylglucosamine transferase [Oscillospiraceae bacterium]|nr:UDP-N-acetylglucosamine--N-acetylmuramyl-(pentapeptide) pyrophosphoryl-undecaprenol N-acetylglucosamine transferase [Oscillospiraceae bacterium]